MIKKLRCLFIGSIIFFSIVKIHAQDPEFSQFYANPMYTNPAFAGSECHRLALAYRIQYYGLPGGYVTFNASYDQRVKKIDGGFGIMYTNDNAGEGILTANHLYAAYAYEHALNKKISLRLGIQGGIFQKSLQWDKLRWGDQIIAQLGFANPTNEPRIDKAVTAANFALGALIYSDKFYGGFAIHNLFEPNQSFFEGSSKLPRRYTVHGGLVIPLDGKTVPEWTITPNILIMSQGKFNQANIGFYVNKGPIVAGFSFRQTIPNTDAFIPMIGFRKGHFKFGYSLDITVSNLRTAGKTAHELTILFEFSKKKKGPCLPQPRCPTY